MSRETPDTASTPPNCFSSCSAWRTVPPTLLARGVGAADADHYITPDLSQIAFRRSDRIAEASEIGYRAAMTALAGWTAP